VIGVSAAIVDAEGRVWTGVSGDSYPGQPITDDMLFDMGSAGKMLAAPLMLDLAEEGRLSLEDPIDKYIDPPPRRRRFDPHPTATGPYQRAGRHGRAS
jgi:D-alanyl-D-alanine carboxypeptidase